MCGDGVNKEMLQFIHAATSPLWKALIQTKTKLPTNWTTIWKAWAGTDIIFSLLKKKKKIVLARWRRNLSSVGFLYFIMFYYYYFSSGGGEFECGWICSIIYFSDLFFSRTNQAHILPASGDKAAAVLLHLFPGFGTFGRQLGLTSHAASAGMTRFRRTAPPLASGDH